MLKATVSIHYVLQSNIMALWYIVIYAPLLKSPQQLQYQHQIKYTVSVFVLCNQTPQAMIKLHIAYLYIISQQDSIILLFCRDITYLNYKVIVRAHHPPSISLLSSQGYLAILERKKWLWLTYKIAMRQYALTQE